MPLLFVSIDLVIARVLSIMNVDEKSFYVIRDQSVNLFIFNCVRAVARCVELLTL